VVITMASGLGDDVSQRRVGVVMGSLDEGRDAIVVADIEGALVDRERVKSVSREAGRGAVRIRWALRRTVDY